MTSITLPGRIRHMGPKEQPTLFSVDMRESPLPLRLRPLRLEDIVGQKHFLNEGFHRLLLSDKWTGFIFWGPPGTGKTTLASVIARLTSRPFEQHSAVISGVKEIREVLELSRQEVHSGKPARILFIDEVHRWSKAQQDVLLPYSEDGSIRFIGATTENPSFEVNKGICSRCVIYHFNPLSEDEILSLLGRAAKEFPNVEAGVLKRIAVASIGDARRALTLLEHLALGGAGQGKITVEDFENLSHSQSLYYDKHSDSHYDTISAFIKSVRGSDPDAAIYYLARMLEAGEDPLFVARRLMILASEDIGNANPMGIVLATSVFTAVHAIGMPEARIILAQATTYLACSEKSNRSYVAIDQALDCVKKTGALEIPLSLRNAPTNLMKEWGYGQGYRYAHDGEKGWVSMRFLPDALKEKRFYLPSSRGVEKRLQDFLKEKGKDES